MPRWIQLCVEHLESVPTDIKCLRYEKILPTRRPSAPLSVPTTVKERQFLHAVEITHAQHIEFMLILQYYIYEHVFHVMNAAFKR